jgi:autotransporter passenger strand-loop-strand repeat protein
VSGGTAEILNGCIASGTDGEQWSAVRMSGGVASGTQVSNGGTEYVANGGAASGTVVSSGFQDVFSSVLGRSTVLNGGV